MQDQLDQKGEAVCFTAGAQGAAFSAGVIHAWLAADRKQPRVVAGISMGSISAAAMQRSMHERGTEGQRTEGSRWGWFRRYLDDVTDHPLSVIWKALPDPVDYWSSTAPVRDTSCPEELKPAERAARYQYWQMVKLGQFFSALPVTIGEIGRLAIWKVRRDERIPVPVLGRSWAARLWRSGSYYFQMLVIGWQVAATLVLHPQASRTRARFIYDELRHDGWSRDGLSAEEQEILNPKWDWRLFIGFGIQPLFGWKIYGLALAATGLPVFVLALMGWLLGAGHLEIAGAVAAILCLAAAWLCRNKSLKQKLAAVARGMEREEATDSDDGFATKLINSGLKAAAIELGFVNSYHLKRRLWEHFGRQGSQGCAEVCCDGSNGTDLMVVAAALQKISKTSENQQVWAHNGFPLIEAIAAACSIPRVFAPVHVKGEKAKRWLRTKDLENADTPEEFDLIDGGAIRKNPLPALFHWMKEKPEAAELFASKSKQDARIHVIYNVPIEPYDANAGKPGRDRIDLIEAAEVGIMMRARRDTKMEVHQTNFLSEIQSAIEGKAGETQQWVSAFADEIAPAQEIEFRNPLEPSREESLTSAAEGCRRTLCRLYAGEIERMKYRGRDFVPCGDLLRKVAPARPHDTAQPGLPEVCEQCTKEMRPYRQPPDKPAIVHQNIRKESTNADVRQQLPALCEKRPRIAFVASGGVFSGAFHIGLVGAFQAMGMKPDLVVGASVGTLMGGALAAVRNLKSEDAQLRLLAELTDTFIDVDTKVALTVCLKTAVKQMGLRTKTLQLSPAKLRAMVRAGTANNAGYAATGVPPLVIDTLSQLFMIPPSETLQAGSSFLAGKFAEGFFRLASLLRSQTLERLQVQYAVIGSSLIEGVARTLLGGRGAIDLRTEQPYGGGPNGSAIFCTAAWVNQRWPLVLGRDTIGAKKGDAFDFLYAALSSSAFPAAFAPRSEAEVFPGAGRVDNLFCDGGTFDNLPIEPTIDILSRTQEAAFEKSTSAAALAQKLEAPDLIISAGFDPKPAVDRRPKFKTSADVAKRACSLSSTVKTESFIRVNKELEKDLTKLRETCEKGGTDARSEKLAKEAVVAGIVNVTPTSELHVNPAFGFARTLGLDRDRVALSIGDGCFQTLFSLGKEWNSDSLVGKSLKAIGGGRKVVRRELDDKRKNECPYFELTCPFQQAKRGQVYQQCANDPTHQQLIQIMPNEKGGTLAASMAA